MFASDQEKVIHDMSYVLLGGQALFAPLHYDANKEPADLAWVANRCAVLMYMTEGNGSRDKKRKHNLRQMLRWLKRWKSGQDLEGFQGGVRCRFGFNDIDHVIGLSIIGGLDSYCCYEESFVDRAGAFKLSACATITNSVFEKLTRNSVGIRDVVALMAMLKKAGIYIDERIACDFVGGRSSAFAATARDEFAGYWSDTNDLNLSWEQLRRAIHGLRGAPGFDGGGGTSLLGIDLSVAELIWLSVAERSIARTLAPPGATGPLSALVSKQFCGMTYSCLVGVSMEHVGQAVASVPLESSLIWMASTEICPSNPIRLIAANPYVGPGILQQELEKLAALERDEGILHFSSGSGS